MSVIQRLGERFWVVPALICLGAAVVAEVLVAVDAATGELSVPSWLRVLLYRVGESGSRDILGAIASSTLAVAGTTFSITIAVMALTSSSYGPRLVRGFMADRGNQVVLGVFVATFLYCLLVLRSIRVVDDGGEDAFVPHLAVNVAVLLAVVDIGVLVYFIHHISNSIQVSTLARGVQIDLCRTIDRVHPESTGDDPPPAGEPPPVGTGSVVQAGRPGYVRRVREDELRDLAVEYDVLIDVRVQAGRYVVDGTTLVAVHPAGSGGDALADAVRGTFEVAAARSPLHDLSFAVQQLTEMAVRALSPGTNDPYTALTALDELSAGLVRLAARPAAVGVLRDGEGRARVRTCRPDEVQLVRSVLDAVRWYAAAAPMVLHGALDLVERVGTAGPRQDLRQELLTQIGLLRRTFSSGGHDDHDVLSFARHADDVEHAVRAGGDAA